MGESEYLLPIITALLSSAGFSFLWKQYVQSRLKFHFDRELANIQATHGRELETLKAALKQDADRELEAVRNENAADLEALKFSFQRALQAELESTRNQYVLKQEFTKADLAARDLDALEVRRRRRDIYPPLADVIYRVRNLARAMVQDGDVGPSMPELASLVQALVEKLFQFRIDLERDDAFLAIHTFKTNSRTFGIQAENYLARQVTGELDASQAALNAMRDLYARIDLEHSAIVHLLKAAAFPSLEK